MSQDERAPTPDALTVLCEGRIEIQGRMPWSSNGTFLVTVDGGSRTVPAIYKPGRTERPLWDFPDGLYRREVAAFELARRLGWDLVPDTVLRHEGPLGVGSLQLFIEANFEEHYFTLLQEDHHHRALARMAAFDLIANNADRKGGHCLLDAANHIWGIDHGLCFHTAPKLRTVIWDFADDDIAAELLVDVARLAADGPGPQITALLHDDELEALIRRVLRVLSGPRFPQPTNDHPYPWPLV